MFREGGRCQRRLTPSSTVGEGSIGVPLAQGRSRAGREMAAGKTGSLPHGWVYMYLPVNSSLRYGKNGSRPALGEGDVGGAGMARGRARSKISTPLRLVLAEAAAVCSAGPREHVQPAQPESHWLPSGPSFLDQSHNRRPFPGSCHHCECFCQLFTATAAPQELRLSVSLLLLPPRRSIYRSHLSAHPAAGRG